MEKTNFEFYKEELDMITNAGYVVGVKDNKPIKCVYMACEDCDLSIGNQNCQAKLIQWLLLPKDDYLLSEDEKALCNLLRTGFIARNKDGRLFWFQHKPIHKSASEWLTISGNCAILNTAFPYCKFEFIKWEDEEAWEVKIDD